MAISIEEVKKMAALARLKLMPAEEKRHAETISAVLDYMNMLNEVDTSAVKPTYQVTGLYNVTRDDAAEECTWRDKLIKQMPAVENGELVVPAVFGEEL